MTAANVLAAAFGLLVKVVKVGYHVAGYVSALVLLALMGLAALRLAASVLGFALGGIKAVVVVGVPLSLVIVALVFLHRLNTKGIE